LTALGIAGSGNGAEFGIVCGPGPKIARFTSFAMPSGRDEWRLKLFQICRGLLVIVRGVTLLVASSIV